MRHIAALLTILTLAAFVVSCGGDDDDGDSPSGDTPSVQDSESTATPVPARDDAPTAEAGETPDDSDGGDNEGIVGEITIGDETWRVVASERCDFESVSAAINVVDIAGHAAGDDSIAIAITFDPRDAGLALTVSGDGRDPDWSAENETFATRVGPTSIGGEGTFIDGAGEESPGTFDVRCQV